jgi:hypothetical protein
MVFALRLDAAIFARNLILYDGICGEKRKFPAQKSLPSAFSREGLSQICNLRQHFLFWNYGIELNSVSAVNCQLGTGGVAGTSGKIPDRIHLYTVL